MGRILDVIPRDQTGQANPSWRFHKWDGHGVAVILRCDHGHEGTLTSHRVSADGHIWPSVVCLVNDCPYHIWASLSGWPGMEKPEDTRFIRLTDDDAGLPDAPA